MRKESGTVRRCNLAVTVSVIFISAFVSLQRACAREFQILYAFSGGSSGAYPQGTPYQDAAGNLYGVTNEGGQQGVLFKLSPKGRETIVHSFQDGSDGANPQAGVVSDKAGNLYGMTTYGGTYECGVIYRVTPRQEETVLLTFDPATDGCEPLAGLTIDRQGNLYGVTSATGPNGGTAFELKPDGEEKILHAFPANAKDGWFPAGTLLRERSGDLYGTTANGGKNCATYGCGKVFRISSDGSETVLYRFSGLPDGAHSYSNVVQDSAGNLIGTTTDGGQTPYCSPGCGTIFILTPEGKESRLYNFCAKENCTDGQFPSGDIVLDRGGSIFGTTSLGGQYQSGTIWKLDASGRYTVLYSLSLGSGEQPNGIAQGSDGTLLGAGPLGGNNGFGTIFSLQRQIEPQLK